jgi:hypothetical protein
MRKVKKFLKELDWLCAGIYSMICTPLAILCCIACDFDDPADVDKFLYVMTGFFAIVLFGLFGEKLHDWMYGDFK